MYRVLIVRLGGEQGLLLALLLFAARMSFSQSGNVTGKVVADKTNEPLAGVSITVKNSTRATSTDGSGAFSILAEANSVLVFTAIGYSTREVPVDNKSAIDVIMESAARSMEEVVVV